MVLGLLGAVVVLAGIGVTAAVLLGRHAENPDDKYLAELRTNGLAGSFASDANAIASAKRTCRALEEGGPPQGTPVDKVAVEVYCPQFSDGFHVLERATVTGTYTLIDSEPSTYYPGITTSGSSCRGTGGFTDIRSGTQVTVKNGKGEVLTTTTLGVGTGDSSDCVFPFSFSVTEGQDAYVISVSHRGDITFSFEQIKNNNVALTLGH